jgi:hypothetical protein
VVSQPRGRLAQLVEQLLYTQRVGGSSPSPPTIPLLPDRRPLAVLLGDA